MIQITPRTSIAVLGFGVEGQGTYAYLLRHGFSNVTIVDEREHVVLPEGAKHIVGAGAFTALGEFQVIFRSPGVYRRHPLVLAAEEAGSVITSQLEYFLLKTPCTVVGVTGTKGKSTTTSILHHILREDGREVFLAGNIGASIIGLLDEVSVSSTVVLELSSFQLQDIRVSPRIAIVLGITPEHLDIHANVEEYVHAKAGIARHQAASDVLLCAPDNPLSADVAAISSALQKWTWCGTDDVSCELPEGAQLGAFCRDGQLWVMHGREEIALLPQSEVPLMGAHMLQNILPALLAAALLGVPHATIAGALASFPAVPHRMEYVGEALGMHFYNDSAATTPEAAMAGIDAHQDYDTAVILGGGMKGVSLAELAAHAARARHVRHIFLLGTGAAPVLADLLSRHTPLGQLHIAANMEELQTLVQKIASPAMHVVLSPGCSSFDIFSDYKARGEAFRELWKGLSGTGEKI